TCTGLSAIRDVRGNAKYKVRNSTIILAPSPAPRSGQPLHIKYSSHFISFGVSFGGLSFFLFLSYITMKLLVA
ncbi:hypothetical protein, partial [Salmonella enterica]|uniref:hypothetical protein n=1 Tax=Salmonella enterica TaxID=28901 RepID=UPI00398C65F4